MGKPDPAPDPAISARIAEAQRAHARGWLLTPLRGKAPYLKGWQDTPAPKLDLVKTWSVTNNVGVRTGAMSRVVVIDDDTMDGSAAATLGLPPTPTVLTGGGGKHHYFRAPSVPIGNSASKLADKVDVKGENGVVAAAGSIHPKTGKPYVWAPGLSPEEIPLAELPESIVSALAKPKRKAAVDRFAPGTAEHERLRKYARAAMAGNIDAVTLAPEGQRNNVLNRCAFVLARFVGAGLLDREKVEQALHDAARTAGLEEDETQRTIRSGIEDGIADPHDLKILSRKAKHAAEDGSGIPARTQVDERNRPVIVVEGGRLPEIVDEAEKALLADGGEQFYQRGTILVRMTRAGCGPQGSGIRRPNGALILIPVESACLIERFTRAASFQKYDARLRGYKVIDCTERIAGTYLARTGSQRVPLLRAVIEAPTLRPDGSILQVPGYDDATQLFFDPGGVEFLPVPENPTPDDALAALAMLRELTKGFPFVEPSDHSVALAAFLTPLVRRSLWSAPLIGFSAPKMGSGKSLLADVGAMLVTGRPAPAMPQGKDEEEDRKRILALLLEGDPVCCIDNVERPLGSAAMCSVLTQSSYRDRVLGRSGTAIVPTNTTWYATGNNLVITGDLRTRVLVCHLDAKVERPEEREFAVNLYQYVPEHRRVLVPAALTILRAYEVAGRPNQEIPEFGRFEEWSRLVRAALVWLGEADPCLSRKRIERADPVGMQILAVLHEWIDLVGDQHVTAGDLVALAKRADSRNRTLRDALLDATHCTEAEFNALRLGHWLARYERRPEGGLRIERVGEKQGTALWRVARVSG